MNSINNKHYIPFHSWYTLGLLTLIYLCHAVDRSVISIVLEPLKQEFGISDSQVGILTGLAYATLYALAGIPIGYLIDRRNRRNLLAVLVAVWSACTVACGFAQNYWHLLTARLTVGAAEAGGAPTALSIISDLFPPDRRSTAISIFWVSTALGTAVSFAIGGLVAAEYGWRAAFFVAGLPGLLLVILLLCTVREPIRGAMDNIDESGTTANSQTTEQAPSLKQSFALLFREKALLNIFIAVSLKSAVLSGVLVWTASFFIRVHDLSIAQAGLVMGVCIAVFGCLGSLLGGVLGDRVYQRGGLQALPLVPFFSSIVTALVCAVLALASNVYVAIVAFALFEIASRTYTAPSYSFLLSSTPTHMRGVIISAMQIGSNLIGYGLGPFIVGLVSDYTGGSESIRMGLLTMAGTSLWASVHFLLSGRISKAASPAANALS
jgi:predicted MFS family arabinose efflux permease